MITIDKTRQAHAEFDVAVARLVRKVREDGMVIPCKKGCDACCSDVALVSVPEGKLLELAVRKMPQEKQTLVRERTVLWMEGAKAAGIDTDSVSPDLVSYHKAKLACPLLDAEEHVCMVHASRPLACRGHYLVDQDPAVCGNRAVEPQVQTLDVKEPAALAVSKIVRAMAVKKKGEEGKHGLVTLVVGMLPRVLWHVLGMESAGETQDGVDAAVST